MNTKEYKSQNSEKDKISTKKPYIFKTTCYDNEQENAKHTDKAMADNKSCKAIGLKGKYRKDFQKANSGGKRVVMSQDSPAQLNLRGLV
jgi:hypothetical protein